jgi:hypothetical protein
MTMASLLVAACGAACSSEVRNFGGSGGEGGGGGETGAGGELGGAECTPACVSDGNNQVECVGGKCVAVGCAARFVQCDGQCIDPTSSFEHCGAGADCAANPGARCSPVESCTNGVCGPACAGQPQYFESFEGLGNITVMAPREFASGLVLTEPTTNSLNIVDCDLGGGFFGKTCGALLPTYPDGTAGLGAGNFGLNYQVIFTPKSPVRCVSVKIVETTDMGASFEVRAVDPSGAIIDRVSATGFPVASWKTNELKLGPLSPFAKIRLWSDGSSAFIVDALSVWTQ